MKRYNTRNRGPINRRILGGLFAVTGMILGCTSADAKSPAGSPGSFRPARYTPGFYEGAGKGYQGQVHVLVQVGSGGILGIEILDHGDDALVGGAAMEELLELVLDANSTELDAVAGATESSAGFLAAVEEALALAAGL